MKKILIFLCIIAVTFLLINNNSSYEIPEQSIRFRVIPNSNSVIDIFMKEKVLEVVNEEIVSYDSQSINESRSYIINSMETLDQRIKEKFNYYNYNMTYDVNYGLNYFPKKEYNDVTYDSGYYESLVITLGKGEGDNFWCVLFPPLCLLEAEESEEVEYEFFLVEIFNKIFKNK